MWMTEDERRRVKAIGQLTTTNPFLPERVTLEREILAEDHVFEGDVWHGQGLPTDHPNVIKIGAMAKALAAGLMERLQDGSQIGETDFAYYETLVNYLLYDRYQEMFFQEIIKPQGNPRNMPFYRNFLRDLGGFYPQPLGARRRSQTPEHLFALFFQIRRAFHFIFNNIIGASQPVAQLRAQVWESIFTHDMQRYLRGMYLHMGDVTTLITGPSGTGKELVASAVGLARYIPFQAKDQCFVIDYRQAFHAVNLTALSPTLIESELFGHRRGAFTDAVDDHRGLLGQCPDQGAVFLDEIGEVQSSIQVKLLRVLQERTYRRLGETKEHHFGGRILAATNRDLGLEMAAGRFREDFFYRLCSDQIQVPSLAVRLQHDGGDLERLLMVIARRVAGVDEAATLAKEVGSWIRKHLGLTYAWPGNVRELEQCVRNYLIHATYQPPRLEGQRETDLDGSLLTAGLTAEELLRHYVGLVYGETGSYQETARRLGLDRRTVKAKLEG